MRHPENPLRAVGPVGCPAFAKKRDDGLYEQDGSDRGAEVVWKAINAYIASGAGNRKTKK